jgi:hypothetical protein
LHVVHSHLEDIPSDEVFCNIQLNLVDVIGTCGEFGESKVFDVWVLWLDPYWGIEEDFKDVEVTTEELLGDVVACCGHSDGVLICELLLLCGEGFVHVLDCQEDCPIEQAVLMHVMIGESISLLTVNHLFVECVASIYIGPFPGVMHQELVQMVDGFNAEHSQNWPIVLLIREYGVPILQCLPPLVLLHWLSLVFVRREIVERPHFASVDGHVPVLKLLSVDGILFVSLQIYSVFDLKELTRLLGVLWVIYELLLWSYNGLS